MNPKRKIQNPKSKIQTLALTLLLLIIYSRGVAPSVATIFDDSLEFPLVVHRLAIAHPTGYPLYTLLGKLFSLFNLQNIAYQLNLMSAFFGALAVGLLYQVGLALWSNIRPAKPLEAAHHAGAALGAVSFGLGPVFFSQATIAEVYTLNAFFLAAVLLLALQQRWLLLAFFFGLSLTHHLTMVLILPAVIAFFWATQQTAGVADISSHSFPSPIKLILVFATPLLLYLYLPLRGHTGSLDGSYEPTLAGFWRHVFGGGYGVFLLENPFGNERTLAFYWHLISNESGWWGVGLGATGFGLLLIWRRWGPLFLTGLALLTYLSFNRLYTVTDIEVFFIPVFLLLALLAGLTVGKLLSWGLGKQPLVMAATTLAMLVFLVTQHQGQSRAGDWAVHDYGQDILSQPLPKKAAIVGILGEMTLLRYFQETGKQRPDLQTYVADRDADRLAQVTKLLGGEPGQAVYLTRQLPGATTHWSLSAEGPLIRVNGEPVRQQAAVMQNVKIPAGVDLPLIPEISLVGYTITRPETHQPLWPLRLTVVWHAKADIPADYKISARLLNSSAKVVAADDKVPVHFAYPTSAWRPNEFISDVYDLQLPPELGADQYTPLLILYDPAKNNAELGRVRLPLTYIERIGE